MKDNLDNISGVNEPIYEENISTYTVKITHNNKKTERIFKIDLNTIDFPEHFIADKISDNLSEMIEEVKDVKEETFICSKCNRVQSIENVKYSDDDSLGNEVQYCKDCIKNKF